MNPIKQKAPGSNPEPSKTRATASAVPRPNEQLNSGTVLEAAYDNRPEAHYLATIAYGEVVELTLSAAQTEKEAAFEPVDHHTHRLMRQAGVGDLVGLYLLLSEYSSYEEKSGSIRYYSVTLSELAREYDTSVSTIKRRLKRLEAAGFISNLSQRQTESPGVSRVAGNAYGLHSRSLRGKLKGAIIYQEPLVDTANSSPMTQSTEAEIELEAKSNTGTMTIGLQVLSTPNRPTSSSTATATSTTSYSNMTTPLVKNEPLVISLRDFDRDLFKPDGKKSSDHSKAKPASEAQLEALGKYLGGYKRAALKLYEIANLSELTAEQADGLIKHTQSNNPELTNRLNRLERELRDKTESEGRAREAATQAQRDYEATQRYKAEQLSIYGRELTEAEIAGRITLIRAQLRDKAPGELRARGKKLKEVEADTSLTPSERLSNLLELING